jgi:hypothetical protein
MTPESNSRFPTFAVFPNHNRLHRLLLEEREGDSTSTRSDDHDRRPEGRTESGQQNPSPSGLMCDRCRMHYC